MFGRCYRFGSLRDYVATRITKFYTVPAYGNVSRLLSRGFLSFNICNESNANCCCLRHVEWGGRLFDRPDGIRDFPSISRMASHLGDGAHYLGRCARQYIQLRSRLIQAKTLISNALLQIEIRCPSLLERHFLIVRGRFI